MRVSDTGERGLLSFLRRRFPGIGPLDDDAALLPPMSRPVITTDSFIEGVHFHRWWCDPNVLGRRLLEAALSDLAAMGAPPGFVTVSTTLTRETELEWLEGFYAGLTSRSDCRLVGGETVSGPALGFTLTAVSDAGSDGKLLRRSGLRPGDGLWLTGRLGRALDVVRLMEQAGGLHGDGLEPAGPVPPAELEQLRAFLTPHAAFEEASILREAGVVCAIDVSDGLLSEAGHLARESGVDVELALENVPLFPSAGDRRLEAACSGEDFVLLFGFSGDGADFERAGFRRVGSARRGPGRAWITQGGVELPAGGGGYDHFRE